MYIHTYMWNLEKWYMCVCVSCPLVTNPWQSHGLQPASLLCPWNCSGNNTRVGCHPPLQGIFPTQGSNPRLLHCRCILYRLSHQGNQKNGIADLIYKAETDTDVESKQMDTKGDREGGRHWETGLTCNILLLWILCIKQTANENILYSSGPPLRAPR